MPEIEGIHSIIQKIRADAEDHAQEQYAQTMKSIDEEIKVENNRRLEELEKRKDSLRTHYDREFKRLLERISSRINREVLIYQKDLLDELFDMAVQKLRAASSLEFSQMFKSAVRGLNGDYTLQIGELSQGVLDSAALWEAERENNGLSIVLADEVIPGKSGFIIQDERVEYNCLFEDLIEDKKREQAAAAMYEVFLAG
ncbi:MAG: hypothetical protein FWH55_07995 [Oscillospiraceae bacterium]|nr:hypothetical protein [Oscillospiraceae bacterium]